MTEEQQAIVAEIVEELKSTPPKARKKRRTKAEMEASTAIVPVEPELADETELWAREAQEQLEVISLCEIETQSDMDEMGSVQRAAFERWKELEAKRKDLKEPALEQGRRIDNLFKPALGYWKAIETACQAKIGAFRKLAAEAQDRALAAVAASGGEADASTLVVAHGANVLALPAAAREVVKWKATIVDTSLLPEWCWKRIIDREAIEAKIESTHGQEKIPGVLVEREVVIVNKAVRS